MGRIFYGCPSPDATPTDIWDVIDPITYEPREGWIELTKQADNGEVLLRPTVEAGVVNALQQECGETARDHRLKEIAATLRTNILGTKLMLIVSELSEGLESLRHNEGAAGALEGKGNFGEELADAIVRILDTGTFTKDNLGDELLKKMAVNKDRPFMHGNKAM
jgi:hypothetical protein